MTHVTNAKLAEPVLQSATVEDQVAELCKQGARLDRSIAVLQQRRAALHTSLKALRRHLHLTCSGCYQTFKIGAVPLIIQERGSWDSYGEVFESDLRGIIVCPHCACSLNAELRGSDAFPGPMSEYVLQTFKYDIRGPEPAQVTVLLKHSRDAAKRQQRDSERQLQLQRARKLLHDAGELPARVGPSGLPVCPQCHNEMARVGTQLLCLLCPEDSV